MAQPLTAVSTLSLSLPQTVAVENGTCSLFLPDINELLTDVLQNSQQNRLVINDLKAEIDPGKCHQNTTFTELVLKNLKLKSTDCLNPLIFCLEECESRLCNSIPAPEEFVEINPFLSSKLISKNPNVSRSKYTVYSAVSDKKVDCFCYSNVAFPDTGVWTAYF